MHQAYEARQQLLGQSFAAQSALFLAAVVALAIPEPRLSLSTFACTPDPIVLVIILPTRTAKIVAVTKFLRFASVFSLHVGSREASVSLFSFETSPLLLLHSLHAAHAVAMLLVTAFHSINL